MDVNACKQELDGIRQAVEYKGWTITPDWRIDMGNNAVGRDPIKAAALQKLQGDLNACKVHAHNTDHELATAIGAAVGEVPLDAVGSAKWRIMLDVSNTCLTVRNILRFEDMMLGRAGSYSAMEVDFLSKNAAAYGYERVGDSWVYVGGG